MTDLPMLLQSFTPTTYGVWTGVLMFLAWMAREWRETRKLSAEDKLARREGYAHQVAELTKENRAIRSEYEEYRRLCHAETESLRRKIYDIEDEFQGFRRKLLEGAINDFRNLPASMVTPMAADAADRVDKILSEGGSA